MTIAEEIAQRMVHIELARELNANFALLAETLDKFKAAGCNSGLIGAAFGCLVGVQTVISYACAPGVLMLPVRGEDTKWRATFNVDMVDNVEGTLQSAVPIDLKKGGN